MSAAIVLQQIPHEGPGTIQSAADRAGWTLDVRALYDGASVPSDPREADALIVMGGPMNVDDVVEYPYLAVEHRLLQSALDAGVPMLGLCLGSQLIAKAAGARVYPAGVKEIGWYTVDVTAAGRDDPLFAGLGDQLPVFHWHGDTYDLPPTASLLCTSTPIPHQAFRLGARVYGVQFHMEVTADMIREWLAVNADELAGVADYISPDAILREMPEQLQRMQSWGGRFLDRWFAMARAQS